MVVRMSRVWVSWKVEVGIWACCTLILCQYLGLSIVTVSLSKTNESFKNDKSLSTTTMTTQQQNPQTTIRQISILGERNSGTRWTWGHISSCFNHSIPVKKSLTRYKHWFQDPEGSDRYPHDTLVIAQFRNPYEWLRRMQQVPHHAPAHLKYSKDKYWKNFLTTKWTTERIGTDITKKYNYTSEKIIGTKPCQEYFEYNDIVSCDVRPIPKASYNRTLHFSEHQPFYEMRNDGSGIPYDNILELRTDKIRNFLSVKDYKGIADLWVVQYEYLTTKGTNHLIKQISEWTGIEAKCDPYPPQQRPPRTLTRAMGMHILHHLNWTVESWIGYESHGPNQTVEISKNIERIQRERNLIL